MRLWTFVPFVNAKFRYDSRAVFDPARLSEFAALFFDLDGTLADSMPVHYRAWRSVLDPQGIEFPEAIFYSWGGTPAREIAARLKREASAEFDSEALATEKEARFLLLLPEVQAIGEVCELARLAHARGLALGVVSGGRRAIVERTLELIGLRAMFSVVIASEDTPQGKPAPDPYVLAASRLHVDPALCLVFEDSQTGEASARGAGMQVERVDQWVRD